MKEVNTIKYLLIEIGQLKSYIEELEYDKEILTNKLKSRKKKKIIYK